MFALQSYFNPGSAATPIGLFELGKNRLLLAAMIVFVAFCSFKIVGTQMEVSEKQYQLQQLEQSIEEQQKLNEELENQLEKGKTDQTEIVGKAAYEQYGYGYPDEHIYIDSQAS